MMALSQRVAIGRSDGSLALALLRGGGWKISSFGVGVERERFLEANKKCGTHSDLGSAACRLPAEAGVGTVAEMVVEGVEYVIRLASGAGAA